MVKSHKNLVTFVKWFPYLIDLRDSVLIKSRINKVEFETFSNKVLVQKVSKVIKGQPIKPKETVNFVNTHNLNRTRVL